MQSFRLHLSVKFVIPFLIFYNLASQQVKAQNLNYVKSVSREESSILLSEYIRYSSVTGNEKSAGEYFERICSERGLNVRIFTDDTDRYNFAASLYPLEKNKPNIIFLNHIDVVPEGNASGWIHPPYSGAIIQDTVWGRGAIDMKGAAIMQLMALSSFAGEAGKSDFPVNVTLLCVSGEEKYGIKGARIICDSLFKELNAIVVFGEGGIGTKKVLPDEPDKIVFAISLSDKRALWLKLYLNYETSGHGAVPPRTYANRLMINALNSLTRINSKIHFNKTTRSMFRAYGEMDRGVRGFILKNPGLFRPIIATRLRKDPLLYSTVSNTITITQFGGQVNEINQIPQEIEVMLDCRLLPETTNEEFLDFLARKMKNEEIDISIIRETVNALPTATDKYYNLFETSINETYPGAGVVPVLFPATTDNNYFRNMGIPAYGIIPAFIDEKLLKTIHNYNERIPVESLMKGIEVYTRFLEKILSQSN